MAARPIWSGFLKLSLVSVPVKAYTATDSSGEVHLNQLHAECKSRIQNKKTCPIHGAVTDVGLRVREGQYYRQVDALEVEPDTPHGWLCQLEKYRDTGTTLASLTIKNQAARCDCQDAPGSHRYPTSRTV